MKESQKIKYLSNRKIFLIMLAWSVAVLMLFSPDSPFHGPWLRIDSAIFFTSGKALMNGMRPYVEFADSKGPLLWLIYGIGYLLSPRSYTGVYVVSCLVYAGIFYYNFKTAHIFLKDDRRSIAVTLLMTFAYFLFWFHFEVRAEDYATLPVAVSLYYLFRLLYGSGSPAAQLTERRYGLVLGGCFMALVMIKFSIAAMQGIIILVMLWYMARERKEYVKPMAWVAVGAVAVALPFLGYLWLRGAVPAFFHEYFFNTIQTIRVDSSETGQNTGSLIDDFIKSWAGADCLSFLMFIVYGGWMLGRQLQHYRYVPLLFGVFFYIIATRHNIGYYYGICHIFFIYLLIWVMGLVDRPFKMRNLICIVAAVAIWGIYVNVQKGFKMQTVGEWSDNIHRENYEAIEQTMSGFKKPRLLYLFHVDMGFGLWEDALPAGKYWTWQLGSTPEMEREHIKLMESGNADFIIVFNETNASVRGCPPGKIISNGYTRVFQRKTKDFYGGKTTIGVFKKN